MTQRTDGVPVDPVHPDLAFRVAGGLGLVEPFLAGRGWKPFTPKDMFRFSEALLAAASEPDLWEHPRRENGHAR